MKKCMALLVLILYMLAMLPMSVSAAYQLPEMVTISAKSAILISLGNQPEQDQIMFERDADAKRPPAAMLRMMVGAYAIKLIREKDIRAETATGTYTAECASHILGTGLTTANMRIGDTWTLKDLLTVTLISSASDVCVTLATALSGSVEAFVEGMNQLAADLGCQNTCFVNVTGLDVVGQYTTARDMAKITRFAMNYPEMQAMAAEQQYTVRPQKGTTQTFVNVNYMVRPAVKDEYYAPLQFGRTGYTAYAGRCMASVAKDKGYAYLAVVMGSAGPDGKDLYNAHFRDTRALYQWAFNTFTYKLLLDKNEPVDTLSVELVRQTDVLQLVAKEPVLAMVDKNLDKSAVLRKTTLYAQSVDAPVQQGQVFGKVELYINMDQKVGETELVAAKTLERDNVLLLWRKVRQIVTSPYLYLSIGLLLVLVAAYGLLLWSRNRNKQKLMTRKRREKR